MAAASAAVFPYASNVVGVSENVKLVKDLATTTKHHIPDAFVLPESERPSKALHSHKNIPVIDLGNLHDAEGRPQVLQAISNACEEWGFFQITNHGVPDSTIERMWQVTREFFDMPAEDKLKYYSDDVTKPTRMGTSFNPTKETTLHWRDYFHQICNPLPDVIETWPDKPESYREISLEYSQAMKSLSEQLLEALAEALGLHANIFLETFRQPDQFLMLNYYPPCPNPDLTFGLASHSDPGGVTILIQDEVEGLQVLHDGEWITVQPLKNSFVINIGDAIQVLSNGRFKSVDHRAVVNLKLRMTIPYFFDPAKDVKIKPFADLVDENRPPLYREVVFGQHLGGYASKPLSGKSAVDYLRIIE
nr:Fe(II)/2-oxoglutarate-dependent dioxygenase 4 [Phlegmariurus tetrastichus]